MPKNTKIREFRESPFCWQSKEALRKIRESIDRRNLSGCICTYTALTEIASDRSQDELMIYLFDVARYSGLSEKTCAKHLRLLKGIGLVEIVPQERTSDGKYTRMKVLLLRFGDTVGKIEERLKKDPGNLDVETSDIKKLDKKLNKKIDKKNTGVKTPKSSSKEKSKKANQEFERKYRSFIEGFNRLTDRKFRGDSKSKRQFRARLKDGYHGPDFRKAILAAASDGYLTDNPQYLTPEYITRQNILEKWTNADPPKKTERFAGYQDFTPK